MATAGVVKGPLVLIVTWLEAVLACVLVTLRVTTASLSKGNKSIETSRLRWDSFWVVVATVNWTVPGPWRALQQAYSTRSLHWRRSASWAWAQRMDLETTRVFCLTSTSWKRICGAGSPRSSPSSPSSWAELPSSHSCWPFKSTLPQMAQGCFTPWVSSKALSMSSRLS